MKPKNAVYLLAMLVLGALAYWGMSSLIQHRIGQPIDAGEAGRSAISAEGKTPEKIHALHSGLRENLTAAVEHLQQGNQSAASHAIDASMRVAEVGQHAAPEPIKAAFEKAHHQVRQVRRALQNGKPALAEQRLSETLGSLGQTPSITAAQEPSRSIEHPDEFEGAMLIDANGLRIGEVQHVSSDGRTATLVLGAQRDILGFIDLGGREIRVSVESLAFGKNKTVGSTLVVLLARPAAAELSLAE